VEYLCEVAHGQARFLGMVEGNEHAWEHDLLVHGASTSDDLG
jgi:hypothetical protein